MRQLARLDGYQKELSKITHTKNIPEEWAAPDQSCRAAIKAVGYGRVIPLNKNPKQTQKIESRSLIHLIPSQPVSANR
jgi:hypothetical protein